jgi:signal transduction histidine kinase
VTRSCLARSRRPVIALVVAFCALSIGHAQTNSIDSLRSVLASVEQADSTTAETLYQLSREYWDRDLDTSFIFAQQLLELSQRIGYGTGVGNAYSGMGVVRWYQGNYPEAQHYHELALDARKATGRKADIAASYHNLGLVNDDQGNYPEALKFYLHAMELYDSVGDREGVAQEYSMIGLIHQMQNDFPAALEAIFKALEIREAAKDDWGLTEIYSNLGVTYTKMENYPEALRWHDKALALRERIHDEQGLAVSYNNYSEVYIRQGRYADAMASLKRSLAINERLGYRKSVSSVQLGIGHLYELQGDLKHALELEELALRSAEEVGAMDYMYDALLALSKTSARIGDHAGAYAYRLRYDALNDSIYDREKTRSLVRQEMHYSFAKQQLADSLANVEKAHLAQRDQEVRLATERNRRNLFALGGIAVLILSIGLWSRLRYVRRTRDTIIRTQQQLVASEKQREAEQVRTRIARDVHDELGSELTHISILVGQTRKEQTGASNAARMDEIASLTREVSSSLSDIVWAVDPQHDSAESLVAHAQHFTERMTANAPIRVEHRFVHHGPDRVLDPATKRNIFLVLKEALNNALKYAAAKNIRVLLETDAGRFKLKVEDDGVGFETTSARGHGQGNMKARCDALGAELRVRSVPGEGCMVEVEGPLGNFTA